MSSFEGEQGVNYCESKGYHFAAARIAENIGTYNMQKAAVRNYLKANKMLPAARVLIKMGDRDGAEMFYLAAVKEQMDRGDYAMAARIEKEMGNEDSAKQLYATAIEQSAIKNDYWVTAMIAEEAGAKLEARVYRAFAEKAEEDMPEII
ncbi:MAG: hypothetical protein WC852_02225 [Candidatus Nanoarchaeia archaeon]